MRTGKTFMFPSAPEIKLLEFEGHDWNKLFAALFWEISLSIEVSKLEES